MITWGISANSHDAAIAVFDHSQLVFASHTERYSKVKNDAHIPRHMVDGIKQLYGNPDEIVWYEKPLLKTARQLIAGQGWNWKENNVREYLKKVNLHSAPLSFAKHHESHAAAGYFTSTFDEACVVVIDAIGEFETLTIWEANGRNLTKKYSMLYPQSVGLWYSAMTQRIGLKPNEEEYILMGMAALGDPTRLYLDVLADFFEVNGKEFKFKQNLHRGCKGWRPDLTSEQDMADIAAAVQDVYETIFWLVLDKAKKLVPSKNLVLMGGCALNCVANKQAYHLFDHVWIMPNPGDAGSSIGAVLAKWKTHIHWPGAFLGHNIQYKHTNFEIASYINETGIVGLARGRAEFGPRALGNRSLLADPRLPDVKDRLNAVKMREPFRPFAPAVLAEYASSLFEMPCELTPYMQFAVKCKEPEKYPGIVHVDGTSRVQTVTKEDNPEFRELLEDWFAMTGCPMLVNTSLNIKGQPMVNTIFDAKQWERKYNIKVFN